MPEKKGIQLIFVPAIFLLLYLMRFSQLSIFDIYLIKKIVFSQLHISVAYVLTFSSMMLTTNMYYHVLYMNIHSELKSMTAYLS